MARPRVGDLVKQTTDTEGIGSYALGPSISGFWPFSEFADGTPIYYTVVDNPDAITECEQGIGRYVAGSPETITRDQIIKSTNSDAKVDWAPGTKTIICTASAEFLNTIIEAVDSDLVTSGTSTAYSVVTLRPNAGLYEGRFLCCKLHIANGAAPTLSIDGGAAKPIVDIHGSAPNVGALTASYFWFKFDATAQEWVVFSPMGLGTAASKNLGGNIVDDGSGNLVTDAATDLKFVPTGAIFHFPSTAAPGGYLELNGAAVSRATYADLWAFAQASGNISATDAAWTAGKFSPGNGTTTFRIPDLRGEFIRGWDDGRGVDSGRAIGSSQADALVSHSHSYTEGSPSNRLGPNDGGTTGYLINNGAGTTGATGETETRPRNIALLPCIKY